MPAHLTSPSTVGDLVSVDRACLFSFLRSKHTDKQTEKSKALSNQTLDASKVRCNVPKVRCVVPRTCGLMCEQGETRCSARC
ncbi:protein of unknown function (plasmid) [Cupriavidus taiwanensis]|uniref:Uncharacterized protein n=2 Tax=Cupriavidus TaxID=106589 RepID=A0A375HY89_9BURK|nr:hypothetical protein CBM2604_P170005 [Cupriavidus taiwanensis]SPD61600.1 protein of unknown function [Cupriavidus taiwanensis]SPD62308.1 protein of unknown function [Cupriavidus neocaledonicus]SPD69431.1 protein of unknown function [Cupriavidus taiwanensis]